MAKRNAAAAAPIEAEYIEVAPVEPPPLPAARVKSDWHIGYVVTMAFIALMIFGAYVRNHGGQ